MSPHQSATCHECPAPAALWCVACGLGLCVECLRRAQGYCAICDARLPESPAEEGLSPRRRNAIASIDLTSEQVNEAIAQAIIDSKIGDLLKAAVDEEVKKIRQGYDNPVKKVIEQEVLRQIQHLVQTEYKEQLRATIQEHLTTEIIDQITIAAWEAFYDKIKEGRSRY